ncbi:T9SS type A sorting domain-containing protein [Aequorivita viscosa]|uniref:Por secretion system C-terminal sorting domain-containing protein n=1 Tax=Aequorivita viscosa TaxID=797419 RepID=A0A1M6FVG8_9FLAO|nr:T9SS type A sorting domain-containing protein [Aequorivita viscosa]SDW72797.1 Por secretion system C-terminal sorting domain-containing protein [Aequorivita viscosa]SHJ01705.1 Por secretion system C-terminal sorting domain-containing protein [Aequorivita viscosa]
MKFKLLVLSVLGSITIASAQYSVMDDNGNVLNDGDIIEFGTTDYPDASYDFFVTNENPDNEIYSRVQLMSAENQTNATFEQLCYGIQCYYEIQMLQFVPPLNEAPVAIRVGATTGLGNHFYNNDPGNGTDSVDYVFAFRQFEDADGTIEIGTPLTFTYRYNPTLGVKGVSKVNLSIESTIVTDQMVLQVNEPVAMKMYDLQGRLVKQAQFQDGTHTVNVSDLSTQAYIVQFRNNGGAVRTTKIMVK